MMYASQIKAAFANMMRTAARDPLSAIVALITLPLRYARSFLKGSVTYLIAIYGLRVILGSSKGDILRHVGDWAFVLFAVVLLIRFLTAPLVGHFGTMSESDTHGTARFAGAREIAPLTKSEDGLLIGRLRNNGQLLRYQGPAHLRKKDYVDVPTLLGRPRARRWLR
ncbi:hypothetical protein FHT78_005017 [Rhizobium sp. BK196]|jgi:type IV secretion system protein VirD4|nr:hypothetical protein [Rhizobium sp. BK196]MBB3464342.1 hypothetical protein [Rhizobium sp. BK377]